MGNFIHQLRAKPEHIRERIAYGTAMFVTAIVAGVWVTSLVTTGILAPAHSSYASFAENSGATTSGVAEPQNAPASSFLGSAVSALTGVAPAKPAHLEIVNVQQSSTVPSSKATITTGRTIIHF